MADKSAFVPVDAIQGHKALDGDVDLDAELFGASKAKPTPVAAPPSPPPVPATPPPAPKPAAPAPKLQYEKAATFTKTYAGQKK